MGKWSEVQVAGKQCDVFEPEKPNEYGYVLIYLHGVHLNRLIDKQPYIDQFEKYGLPVLAPHAGSCWWVDRICPAFDAECTPEQHVLRNIVPFVKERWGSEPPRIGLFGTSMGGQGALRLSYKYPNIFPIVAGVAPAIDFQNRYDDDEILQSMYPDPEAVRQETAILYIHPLNWPRNQFFCCDPEDYGWWDSADRLHMKLGSLGVPHEYDLETRGGGHGFEYYNLMAEKTIGFLAEAFDKERRRLV